MRYLTKKYRKKMNWFKKAQIPIVDSRDIPTGLGSGEIYTDIGHDITCDYLHDSFDYADKRYDPNNPNMLWVWRNGRIETIPEQRGRNEYHRYGFEEENGEDLKVSRYYRGRYSPSRKIITLLAPWDSTGHFREIPNSILSALQQAFPKAEKLIRYSKNNSKIKTSEIILPGETIPDQYPGLYFEAIKLKDGTILYMQDAINHWVIFYKYKHFIGDVSNIESTGFIDGDGAYLVKYMGDEARQYFDKNYKNQ